VFKRAVKMPVSQDVQYEHEFSQSFCCNRAEALGRTRCSNSKTSLTGLIAKGLNLVAIVVGSLMFAFSEGGNKRVFNLFGSLLGGLLVFGSLFLMAQWATRTNPQILRILLNSNKFGREYDSAKYSDPNVRVIHHA
jgi:hypothetical protein